MRKLIIAFIGMCCFMGVATAQEGFHKMKNPESFKQKINQISKVTETIQCNFVQEKQLSFMKEKMVSKGVFYFNKNNRLRWEYNNPYNYVIIMDGKQLAVIDNGKVTKMDTGKNDTFQKIQGMLTRTLQGNVLDGNNQFNYELLENEQYSLVKLTPKDKEIKNYLTGIDLFFDKKDGLVARIDMHEAEDLTTIKFSNRKLNQPIADGVFRSR